MSRCRALAGFASLALAASSVHAQFEAPAGYYDGATGTGATLKSQLYDAMRDGHIERAYGDFRNTARFHDADPDVPGNILLAYNVDSTFGNWTDGVTWNREHVWPQSLQPGSASNTTRGNLGDPHALKPCNPSINGSRSNKPFGFAATTGAFGSQGAYYFPGDTDKGDIARSLFYSDTRYGSELGLSLVRGFPSGNQMGDLDALIAWHYLDPPSTFERRRNFVVFTQAENPAFFTNNRNAYIDHPEFAWSVYQDQENDTRLSFGAPEADGSSSVSIDLGFVFADSPSSIPSLTLDKDGNDGTFYELVVTGDFLSPSEGRYNAFPMITTGADQQSIPLALATTFGPGTFFGTVTVDNLDVTTMGGPGRGANDADDIATISVTVLDRAQASFELGMDVDMIAHDFGQIELDAPEAEYVFSVCNLLGTPGATAPLDLELMDASGDTDAITTGFVTEQDIEAGTCAMIEAVLTTDLAGDFTATYTFMPFDDQSIPGAGPAGEPLVIVLTGSVVAPVCPGDCDLSGAVDFSDLIAQLAAFGTTDAACDADASGTVNFADLVATLGLFGPCP